MVEYTKEEIIQHRKDWVAALRSGNYKQTTHYLHNNEGYCCLGVAAELAGIPYEVDENGVYTYSEVLEYEDVVKRTTVLNNDGMKYYGLRESNGRSFNNHKETLADYNDSGMPFNDIADIIESEPEGLFINV